LKKTCAKCKRRLPVDKFYKRGRNLRGKLRNVRHPRNQYHSKCWRIAHLSSEFNIPKSQMRKILSGERCEICGASKLRRKLDLDHCHKTGEIRGLLCESCNKGIGLLRDDVQLLRKAIKYLRSYTA
jgi:hypothetical protein